MTRMIISPYVAHEDFYARRWTVRCPLCHKNVCRVQSATPEELHFLCDYCSWGCCETISWEDIYDGLLSSLEIRWEEKG